MPAKLDNVYARRHTKFLAALLRSGSIRAASAEVGISYQRGQQIAHRIGYRVVTQRWLGEQLLPPVRNSSSSSGS